MSFVLSNGKSPIERCTAFGFYAGFDVQRQADTLKFHSFLEQVSPHLKEESMPDYLGKGLEVSRMQIQLVKPGEIMTIESWDKSNTFSVRFIANAGIPFECHTAGDCDHLRHGGMV